MLVLNSAFSRLKRLPLVNLLFRLMGALVQVTDFVTQNPREGPFQTYVAIHLQGLLSYVFPHIGFWPDFELSSTLRSYDWTASAVFVVAYAIADRFWAVRAALEFLTRPELYAAIKQITGFAGMLANFSFNYHRYLQLFGHCWPVVPACVVAWAFKLVMSAGGAEAPEFPLQGLVQSIVQAAFLQALQHVVPLDTTELLFAGLHVLNLGLKLQGQQDVWARLTGLVVGACRGVASRGK